MCGPRGLKGEQDHLFHNNGDGTFTDVSEKAGVSDKAGYYGLAAAFVDINNDGKPDLLVADDSTPNYLYLNKGDGTFEDISYASGYALNKDGRETASMGIAIGDYRNNGLLDIYHTTFSDDYKPLYRNDGDANFTDISYEANIAEVSIPFLGWGTAFFDYDNDGWKDLFTVNGHVYRGVDNTQWGTTWAQRPLLFHNLKGAKFEIVPAVEGTGLARGDDLARHGLWRPLQRRPHRRRHQQHGLRPRTDAQRHGREEPLDRLSPDRLRQEPARRHWRHRLPERQMA